MRLPDVIRMEPVLIQGALQSTIALAVAFGVKLSELQIGALLAFTAALLAVITRTAVPPYIQAEAERRSATGSAAHLIRPPGGPPSRVVHLAANTPSHATR